jgi:hypothetical protein
MTNDMQANPLDHAAAVMGARVIMFYGNNRYQNDRLRHKSYTLFKRSIDTILSHGQVQGPVSCFYE